MQPLSAEWTRQRDEARDTLLALLDSKAYSHFVAEYMDFTATPGAGELDIIPGTPILVRDRAAGRIWQAYETVRAHDTTLAWADVPALHALRIDGKRLRYTLEFFREVLPSSADLLVARVTEMQDHLGLLNDADVAAHTSRAFLATHAARLALRLAAGGGAVPGVARGRVGALAPALPAHLAARLGGTLPAHPRPDPGGTVAAVVKRFSTHSPVHVPLTHRQRGVDPQRPAW